LAATGGPAVTLSLLVQGGDGRLAAAREVGTYPTAPAQVVVGALDGDGRPDVVSHDGERIVVRHQQPDGSLGPPAEVAAGGYRTVALADLNGDGLTDIATAGAGGAVHYRTGDRAWTGAVALEPDSSYPRDLAVADVDRDGRTDVV